MYITLKSLHPELAQVTAEYQDFFETLVPLGEIDLTRGGVTTDTVLLYQAQTMVQAYPYPYG